MIKKILKFFLKLFLWFVGLSVLWVLLYKFVPVPYTSLMAIRAFEGDEKYETRHDWIPIEEISPNLQLAVICAEDQNFLSHNGFSRAAIEKALENNKKGKKLRGGSTISQQTAKNVFLWPERSWFRKGMEAYFTLLIEALWSKERILEVYLNSIEMGNGVFGAEAASHYWFKKPAAKLSRENAGALASILPSPQKYRANPPGPYVARRTQWVVQQMRYHGKFTLEKKEPKEDKKKKKK
ncbi:monofunctional biosynthetic peptidoglycan transglycosylase [Aequorivita echinoideorum]|uniref:Biosynthetic peptidoglycan transglycosylase n=1 Tax=Aequorivita echinoideorum TaxID=1549647 RepID=A0ABS5S1L2_9FLAO|nr:monofunctional biosynthetic peptidoglycan transglycosylase [Aequorivita echinoideorum]MBT0607097.1 monofunctional biosynthetic peptidoglycan transglycosylase [Aequorivita echinoideorum]